MLNLLMAFLTLAVFVIAIIILREFLTWDARMQEAQRCVAHRARLRQSGNTLRPELTKYVDQARWFHKYQEAQEIAELFRDGVVHTSVGCHVVYVLRKGWVKKGA